MIAPRFAKPGRSAWALILGNTDLLAAVVFVAMVMIIIIPISPGALDLLLTMNIAISLVILLTTLFTGDTRQFGIFPSVLLATTLLRLALNVSSTRLILSQADAGRVVEAFGQFVVSGNYVVGMIIFIIITVVQFVVITNGAGRIAEVAARFALDALPGKQMSIDADFNAGLIDEEMARRRRKELQKEADFYGAMDGASKFVRGDAIAGIVIVLINIIGGLAIGILQRNMGFQEAVQVYITLTVGDGLVAQLPALLISTAAGMLVTRSTAEASFGEDITSHLFTFPKVILLTAVLLFFLGIVPGLPTLPFFILSGACGALAFSLLREKKQLISREEAAAAGPPAHLPGEADDFRSLIQVELLEVEIGYTLVPLTDKTGEGNLLERITAARRRAVQELGMIIQPIRVRDNLHLAPNEYLVKLKGNEIARGQIRPHMLMTLNPDGELPQDLEGISTREPSFNLPALWIREDQREEAEALGCTVVDAVTVMITHLTEVIKNSASELLTRQAVKEMLQAVKESHPAVVEELLPETLNIGEIQKVLQNLLREKVPLHDLLTILEELADQARKTREIELLTISVREALKRTITRQHLDAQGRLKVITIDPALEKEIADSLQATRQGVIPLLDPLKMQRLIDAVGRISGELSRRGLQPVILTSPNIRMALRRLLEKFIPVTVLSINEILSEVKVEAVGVIKEGEN